MKNIWISILALGLGFAGCSGKPAASAAKAELERQLAAQFGDVVQLASFTRTNATEGELLGLKFYNLDYDYEVSCKAPVPIEGLGELPVENVASLDNYLSKQNVPWDKLDFKSVLRLSLSSTAARRVFSAYTARRSLLFCRPGERVQLHGDTQFVRRENGWEIN